MLWEHAAEAALTNADWAAAVEQAGQAADAYRQGGDARSAARAQAIAGQALRLCGPARPGARAANRRRGGAAGRPRTPTPSAPWANWRGWRCSPAHPTADALSAEALALGQDLAVDDATLAGLFTTRGICHGFAGRRPQAAANFREAARLAGQAGDTSSWAARCSTCPTR